MLSKSLRYRGSLRRMCPVLSCTDRRFMAQVADVRNIPTEDDKLFNVPLSEESFETYNFDPPPYTVDTTKRKLKDMYRDMLSIRRMESTGQEAVAVGIEHAITKEDKLITAYRSHGFTFMRGASIRSIVGELLGRQDGISHGKGGSMHMFLESFFGGNGIVGAHVPVGAGIAFAQQYNDGSNVTIDIYGDGAANQGQVYEAFNMAKLWNLPILFGCENNKYGMGTSAERASAITDYHKRGQYIPGLRVNGMDVLAVLAAMKHGKQFIQAGKGPLIYDLRERLIEWGIITEDEAKAMDKDVHGIINQEVAEAEKMTEPELRLDVLFEDVYARGSEPKQRRGRTLAETFY
ncbi:putative pyruvate dehydrogenase E1 component alpha subunit [Aspergillus clavatus NRRL 1]|uniref:Pyruvate dehydrogenase n=1 Tax=Aspergillus clavatus (strain ATCC 1007 / CBS 513.65 / DSM 816 / NCTC 3887 / NRRL 1 / QM 1276 / 107) TaxID=344612 RepID=A1CEI6_ASPCL|nr:pyruvate dehydrogenase [Aspergillus clavatus NRRL 1]EAW11285.1 pyruvate dehydrogenase [Aspergillus clavatus NRRL 1]